MRRRFPKNGGWPVEEIILWESDCKTIRACEIALHEALKKLGLKAIVTINSEPPLIARNQLWGRLPVLEIQGLHLSLRPGCAFTVEELTRLFKEIFADQPIYRRTGIINAYEDPSFRKAFEALVATTGRRHILYQSCSIVNALLPHRCTAL